MKTIVTILIVVGASVALAMQHGALNRTREENAQLRQQLDETAKTAAAATGKQEVDSVELSRLRAEHAELIRLRGELAALRQRGPATAALATQAVPFTATAGAAPVAVANGAPMEFAAGVSVPVTAWADVGLQTPEAAAQTLLFAALKGDVRRMAEASGKEETGEPTWQKPLSEVQSVRMLTQGNSIRVNSNAGEATDESMIAFEYQLANGKTEQGFLGVKQKGNDWVVSRVAGFPMTGVTAETK
ncbi:MAG TPA: hypothetical protein VHH73_00985 [Verrucomicrobiae bacterium]|nr:hypothetical protein [Verrucomicrobiae bacterium]